MKLLMALILTEGVLVRGLQGIRAGVNKDAARHLANGRFLGRPPVGEAEAGNNLAVPLLLAENKFLNTPVSNDLPVLNIPLTSFYFTPVPVGDASDQCLTDSDTIPIEPTEFCYYNETTEDFPIAWLQKSSAKWGCWLIPSTFYFADADGTLPFHVQTIDVGDRLESPTSIPLSATKIRVETTMLQGGLNKAADDDTGFSFADDSTEPQALPMVGPLLGTQGTNEIHGTTTFNRANDPNATGTVYMLNDLVWVDPPFESSLQAIVYSACAKYYIQRIGELQNPILPLPAGPPLFDISTGEWGYITGEGWKAAGTVYVNVTPPGEITVSGRFTYGYNWSVQKYLPGVYRITFLIDPNNCETNAVIDDSTSILEGTSQKLQSYVIKASQYVAEKYPDRGGGVYIDVPIKPSSGGGGLPRKGVGAGGNLRN